MTHTIGIYLDAGTEAIIVKALRLLASSADPDNELASDFAHALSNDTWLLMTSEPPQ